MLGCGRINPASQGNSIKSSSVERNTQCRRFGRTQHTKTVPRTVRPSVSVYSHESTLRVNRHCKKNHKAGINGSSRQRISVFRHFVWEIILDRQKAQLVWELAGCRKRIFTSRVYGDVKVWSKSFYPLSESLEIPWLSREHFQERLSLFKCTVD